MLTKRHSGTFYNHHCHFYILESPLAWGHCHRQHSFSGLPSPGRSHYTIDCHSRVQTLYCKTVLIDMCHLHDRAVRATFIVTSLPDHSSAFWKHITVSLPLQVQNILRRTGVQLHGTISQWSKLYPCCMYIEDITWRHADMNFISGKNNVLWISAESE